MKRILFISCLGWWGCDQSPAQADLDLDAAVGDACVVDCMPDRVPDRGSPPPGERVPLPAAPACGIEFEPFTCERLQPRTVPMPDCALGLEVEAIEGLEPFILPFDSDYPIRARFLAKGQPGDTVRWQLAGEVPAIIDIDPCSGELQGTLYWSESLDLQVVAVVGEGPDCRMGTLLIPTGPAACALPPPPARRYALTGTPGRMFEADLPIFNPEGGAGSGRVRLASGTLPPGLELDCEGARLVGVPREEGEFTFEFEWIERACSGLSGRDEVHITIERPCGGCPEGELCVQWFDGVCGVGTGCQPNPLACAHDTCTPECNASICGEFFGCGGEICGLEVPGLFHCYGP